jgi:hypothetical protein
LPPNYIFNLCFCLHRHAEYRKFLAQKLNPDRPTSPQRTEPRRGPRTETLVESERSLPISAQKTTSYWNVRCVTVSNRLIRCYRSESPMRIAHHGSAAAISFQYCIGCKSRLTPATLASSAILGYSSDLDGIDGEQEPARRATVWSMTKQQERGQELRASRFFLAHADFRVHITQVSCSR